MKSKYLLVAVLALGLSSVAGAVGCSNDIDCERVNCEHRAKGISVYLGDKGTYVDVKATTSAVCKKVGGEAKGLVGHCVCNLTISE